MENDKLRKLVNKSGFPLQIAIESKINNSDRHEWNLLFAEHYWEDRNSNDDGFIDLILEHQDKKDVIVVECKRVKETSWIFLQEKKSSKDGNRVKIWINDYENKRINKSHWHEANIQLTPPASESMFCVVSKKGNAVLNMIERTAAELTLATESFAKEDFMLCKPFERYYRRFLSVIVTTAELKLCEYDPSDISISSGEFENAEFQPLPYIRFRKQLSGRQTPSLNYSMSSDQISKAKENTVVVVNSNYLDDFLTNLTIE